MAMQRAFPHIDFRREVTIGHLLADIQQKNLGNFTHAAQAGQFRALNGLVAMTETGQSSSPQHPDPITEREVTGTIGSADHTLSPRRSGIRRPIGRI